MDVVIPTNLVCVLFDPAIPTSSFNYIVFMLVIYIYITCRGWEQLEVTCNPRLLDKNNIWNVEGNENNQCETDNFLQLIPLLAISLLFQYPMYHLISTSHRIFQSF